MSKHHYYISVKNQFNSDCTIYCGTNLPKMAKAYAKLEKFRDYGYDIKLDEDMNYDPDCGAFTYYLLTVLVGIVVILYSSRKNYLGALL